MNQMNIWKPLAVVIVECGLTLTMGIEALIQIKLFAVNATKNFLKVVKKTNLEISAKIGINSAARLTCVKPEGTLSCMVGTSSGVHPHHAKRYFRRVQANKSEEVYQFFKKHKAPGAKRSIQQVLEKIYSNSAWLKRDGKHIEHWLKQNSPKP